MTDKTPMERAAASLPRTKPIATSWPFPRPRLPNPMPHQDAAEATMKLAERMGIVRKTPKKKPASPDAHLSKREQVLLKPIRMLAERGIADEATMRAVRAALKLVDGGP